MSDEEDLIREVMEGELAQAVHAIQRRKVAIRGGDPESMDTAEAWKSLSAQAEAQGLEPGEFADQALRRMVVGLDINMKHAVVIADHTSETYFEAFPIVMTPMGPMVALSPDLVKHMLASVWLEGLATGALHHDNMSRDAAS